MSPRRQESRLRFAALIVTIAAGFASFALAEAIRPLEPSQPGTPQHTSVVARSQAQPAAIVPESEAQPVSWGTRVLWYLPNRLIDLVDILRLRLRLGPGLAANARLTDYGSFYVGDYSSVYVGFPGPRNPRFTRPPYGIESMKGIVIGGVDATDDTRHGPEYGLTEVDLGAHLLLVGGEVGVDPMEIGDFLAGLLCFDLMGDDYPHPRLPEPDVTSAVSFKPDEGLFGVAPKPAEFSTWEDRLDYLHTNVQRRVSEPVRMTDEYFAASELERVPVPDSRLRLGTYFEFVEGKDSEFSFDPDIDMDVAVPNMEKKLRVFVQSARADELPGRTRAESDEKGITVGARSFFSHNNISADAGVRVKWPPEAYTRLSWRPIYHYEKWTFRPEQRIFYETDDKFGELSKLRIDRWLDEQREYYLGAISAAKWTQDDEELEWEQTFRWGHVRKVINARDILTTYARDDIASGGDVAFSIFGRDDLLETYRLTVGMRRPLYRNWVFWELEPGVEWKEEEDFDIAYRLTLGLDMLFWGPELE